MQTPRQHAFPSWASPCTARSKLTHRLAVVSNSFAISTADYKCQDTPRAPKCLGSSCLINCFVPESPLHGELKERGLVLIASVHKADAKRTRTLNHSSAQLPFFLFSHPINPALAHPTSCVLLTQYILSTSSAAECRRHERHAIPADHSRIPAVLEH